MVKDIKISLLVRAVLLLLISLVVTQGSKGQNTKKAKHGIQFSNRAYNEILDEAKVSHKLIFVDAYATWCIPCKQLKKISFQDKNAADYYNKTFINYSIDVEKGSGPDLAKMWGITGLPTLLILDEGGEVLGTHVGFVDGNGLLQFAKATVSRRPNL